MENDRIIDDLTQEQSEAVTAEKGPIAVIAGPGTGKTRVLAHRIAHAVEHRAVDPRKILAVTFTHRAGEQLRERIGNLLGGTPLPFAGTFHALGISFLKRFQQTSFTVIPPLEQEALAKRLWSTKEKPKPDQILSRIIRVKEEGMGLEDIRGRNPDLFPWYQSYEDAKDEDGRLDLTDLILKPLQLMRSREDIRKQAHALWPYLLVDEFQDVNPVQLGLVEALGGSGEGVFVIGDPNQAIYAFRGACTYALEILSRIWPCLRTLKLTSNWRSSRFIVEASKKVLPPSGKRTAEGLRAVHNSGPKILVSSHPSPKSEATWVTRMIERLLGGTSHFTIDSGWADDQYAENVSFGDIAVLYRTNYQGDIAEEALRQAGLPYRRVTSKKPAEQENVAALFKEVQALVPSSHKANVIVSFLKDRELSPDIKTLVKRAEVFEGTVEEFLWNLSLFRPEDTYIPGAHITLMTMHAAKGLEFEAVFVIGMGKGVMPFSDALDSEDEEEEKRLLYVSFTRAKTFLFLSYFTRGMVMGRSATGEISPFLREIPSEFLDMKKPEKSKKTKPKWRQLDLFR